MADSETPADVTALTVQLLSAYLTNNNVAHEDLPGLIRETRAALVEQATAPSAKPVAEAIVPAVSVRKSLASPEHILSLIDGKPYKTLKRHLSAHGLTPKDYRERYKLPATYPLVAPAFAEARRAVAAKIGLGRRPVSAASEHVPLPAAAPVEASAEPLDGALSSVVVAPKSKMSGKRVITAAAAGSPEPIIASSGEGPRPTLAPKPRGMKMKAQTVPIETSDPISVPSGASKTAASARGGRRTLKMFQTKEPVADAAFPGATVKAARKSPAVRPKAAAPKTRTQRPAAGDIDIAVTTSPAPTES